MAAESLRHHPKSRSTERAGRAPQLRPTREEALRPSRGESSLRKRYDCFDSVLVSCVEIVALMCSGGGSAIAERRERGAQGREGREESVSGSAASFPTQGSAGHSLTLRVACRAKDKEVQKKEAAVAKQAQAMSMFFKSKPVGTAAPSRPLRRESPAGPSSAWGLGRFGLATCSRIKSLADFSRRFPCRPCTSSEGAN